MIGIETYLRLAQRGQGLVVMMMTVLMKMAVPLVLGKRTRMMKRTLSFPHMLRPLLSPLLSTVENVVVIREIVSQLLQIFTVQASARRAHLRAKMTREIPSITFKDFGKGF